jgi:hypothetical protein
MSRTSEKRKPTKHAAKTPPIPEHIDTLEDLLKAAYECELPLTMNPTQLLRVVLKGVLKDRITDAEVEKIVTLYHDTVVDWWGKDDGAKGSAT